MRAKRLLVMLSILAGSLTGGMPTASALGAEATAFTGAMYFGSSGSCNPDGSGSVGGDGLYFPGIADHDGYWHLQANTVLGYLQLCGTFGTPLFTGTGGACGFYSGDGQGSYASGLKSPTPFSISGLTWEASVPRPVVYIGPGTVPEYVLPSFNETVVATGNWTRDASSGVATLSFNTQGSLWCWGTGGSTTKSVVGTLTLT